MSNAFAEAPVAMRMGLNQSCKASSRPELQGARSQVKKSYLSREEPLKRDNTDVTPSTIGDATFWAPAGSDTFV